MARRRYKSYPRYDYPRYANDNFRPVPRLVYSGVPSVFKPRPFVRGFSYLRAAAAMSAVFGAARRRYLSDLDLQVLDREDRRRFDPRRSLAPAGGLSVGARRLVVPGAVYSTAPGPIPVGINFAVPAKVAICVRRRVRREVIMAKGKGGGGHRPPRRSYWSDVGC